MMARLLDGLAVAIFFLVMIVPAFLLALVDTPAGRIGYTFW